MNALLYNMNGENRKEFTLRRQKQLFQKLTWHFYKKVLFMIMVKKTEVKPQKIVP